jgi:nucleoside 2-deoxyribosyltransferase
MSGLRIYLAGPDVFLPDAAALAQAKRELCARHGFVGVSPVDNGVDVLALPKREAAQRLSTALEAMIRGCDLLIANVTPFRGPSADVGTVYEMGYARALGRPIFAYTNVAGTLLERTRQTLGEAVRKRPSGEFEDAHCMVIEDFEWTDNLMLVGAVEAGGSPVIVSPTPEERRFTDLAGFEECLKLAAQRLE